MNPHQSAAQHRDRTAALLDGHAVRDGVDSVSQPGNHSVSGRHRLGGDLPRHPGPVIGHPARTDHRDCVFRKFRQAAPHIQTQRRIVEVAQHGGVGLIEQRDNPNPRFVRQLQLAGQLPFPIELRDLDGQRFTDAGNVHQFAGAPPEYAGRRAEFVAERRVFHISDA